MKRNKKGNGPETVLHCLKAAILACILTAALALLMALALRWGWIALSGVKGWNVALKAISACFAGWIMAGKPLQRGLWIAGTAGLLYMITAFAVFGILNGAFSFGLHTVSDLLMAFACASCTYVGVRMIREKPGKSPAPGTKAAAPAPSARVRG